MSWPAAMRRAAISPCEGICIRVHRQDDEFEIILIVRSPWEVGIFFVAIECQSNLNVSRAVHSCM